MRYTPNYNMVIGEGTDAVNPLTQIFPNFETIDTAMENNKNAGITTASEVTTGGVHAIVRVNTSAPVFRFTATSAWTTGDTMTLDGSAVTVHLADGTAPKSGAYVIGAEVVGIVNGSLVTLLAGASFDGVLSFNSRQGVVTPQSGDYTANMIGYNNTSSGLSATDIQSAVDELAALPSGGVTITLAWDNPNPTASFAEQDIDLDSSDYDLLLWQFDRGAGNNDINSTIIAKNQNPFLSSVWGGSNGATAATRFITRISDTKFHAQSAIYAYGTTAGVTNNSNAIPIKVYRIKF